MKDFEEKSELMEQSILKNIQELSELCVECGITNAYDLMVMVEKYSNILEQCEKSKTKTITIKLGSEEE